MIRLVSIFLIIITLFSIGCRSKNNHNRQTNNASVNIHQISSIDYENTAKKTDLFQIQDYPFAIKSIVSRVKDGDTVVIKYNKKLYNVRLYGIDTPEKSQVYGPQATGILKSLILNREIELKVFGKDRNSRLLAKIYCDTKDINAEMIRIGAAWHYKYYDKSSDYPCYNQLENYARTHKLGLWNRPNPIPPWEYRKQKRKD